MTANEPIEIKLLNVLIQDVGDADMEPSVQLEAELNGEYKVFDIDIDDRPYAMSIGAHEYPELLKTQVYDSRHDLEIKDRETPGEYRLTCDYL